jgi:hypothetical protein
VPLYYVLESKSERTILHVRSGSRADIAMSAALGFAGSAEQDRDGAKLDEGNKR